MSAHYQRFIKVLEKWPLEKSKVGRDLGEQLRKQVKSLTNPTVLNTETSELLNKQIDALERLANNVYGKKYPRRYDSTATGLTPQQCTQVLSSEFLQYLNDNSRKRKI